MAVRIARATVHAKRTPEAEYTTLRDLGTEGAAYADAGIKRGIEQGIIPGPPEDQGNRSFATGSYASSS